jgi:hypothetical protein
MSPFHKFTPDIACKAENTADIAGKVSLRPHIAVRVTKTPHIAGKFQPNIILVVGGNA